MNRPQGADMASSRCLSQDHPYSKVESNGSFTQAHLPYSRRACFLYYYFSVSLCNFLSKIACLMCQRPSFGAKADAKVNKKLIPSKYLEENFLINGNFFRFSYKRCVSCYLFNLFFSCISRKSLTCSTVLRVIAILPDRVY